MDALPQFDLVRPRTLRLNWSPPASRIATAGFLAAAPISW